MLSRLLGAQKYINLDASFSLDKNESVDVMSIQGVLKRSLFSTSAICKLQEQNKSPQSFGTAHIY